MNKTIEFDPYDLDGIRKIIEENKDSREPFFGENKEGEAVSISVNNDCVVVVTEQKNGWNRKNTYYTDGTREELFCGRWK